ncbi:MAG: hypothetical protein GXY85_09235 [Candidatus Brocadiaceae bacterium]|nr:hypothetical protein [Candidatus Brocadiaceae bacterium]
MRMLVASIVGLVMLVCLFVYCPPLRNLAASYVHAGDDTAQTAPVDGNQLQAPAPAPASAADHQKPG